MSIFYRPVWNRAHVHTRLIWQMTSWLSSETHRIGTAAPGMLAWIKALLQICKHPLQREGGKYKVRVRGSKLADKKLTKSSMIWGNAYTTTDLKYTNIFIKDTTYEKYLFISHICMIWNLAKSTILKKDFGQNTPRSYNQYVPNN